MGREIKRVALDFKWELNMVWKGYLNPYSSQNCKSCDGSGLNKKTKELQDSWYSFNNCEFVEIGNKRYNKKAWCNNLNQDDVNALALKGRLMDFTHVFIPGKGYVKKDPEYIPNSEEVNKRSREGLGHDSINKWICVKARSKREGYYGLCEFCNGEGEIWQSEEIKKLYEDWESIEPPKGEGWQMWETCSEGSPISEVCKTAEELAKWLVDNKVSSFGYQTETYDTWLNMIKGSGWAMSGAMVNGEIMSGVKALTDNKEGR